MTPQILLLLKCVRAFKSSARTERQRLALLFCPHSTNFKLWVGLSWIHSESQDLSGWKGTTRIIESASLLLTGLPKIKPRDWGHHVHQASWQLPSFYVCKLQIKQFRGVKMMAGHHLGIEILPLVSFLWLLKYTECVVWLRLRTKPVMPQCTGKWNHC